MKQGIKVVLAEDHTLVRDGTRALLEAAGGIEVIGEAADGEEAVRMALHLRPDVLIVDIGLPHLNGIDVIRRIGAALPDVRLLALTVHDEDQYVMAAITAGAAGYILKDIPGHQLVEAVKSVMADKSVLEPTIAHRVYARLARDQTGEGRLLESPLSQREKEVLEIAASGRSNREIASRLRLSVKTVQTHLSHTFRKLGAASRTEAVFIAFKKGWILLDEPTEEAERIR